MNRMLDTDLDFFSAAMAQITVEIGQEDSAGVYYYVDTGVIEKYTPERVKIRNTDGEADHYFRDDITMYRTRIPPTSI
ncbi:hypothetical protein [Paenibacillus popilliae]|uniref:KTSC domain-containing protein n=1 Tax=Paenibacillus popilliae TaxID=78057 RepID=A0ABY3AQU9_PAEPP|nr:hypothetical protein [Paenibacillus sp. SDF0028]TQR44892.1 hypothetical protein C7Y44_11250 [Paenibacillus sp. SDF0028]